MNLVVQGPRLSPEQIAHVAGARGAERLGATAIRVCAMAPDEAIRGWCREQGLDCAFVPEGRRFADLKLLAMDMDSTLIAIECIDELGDLAGKQTEISAVTASAMRGEIDFSESLRRRVRLLSGMGVDSLERVYRERLRLSPGAEALTAACHRHGVKLLLVSGGFTFFTDRLKARLSLDYTLSNELELSDAKLSGDVVGTIVDAEAKAKRFREIAHALGAAREQTVAIGDGANDLKMLAEAGLSVAYRAKPVVKAKADCALDFSGLDGVVNLFE
ncbi:MAG: phosphoserine phosphatase SerB [Burkholderiales bacterium]